MLGLCFIISRCIFKKKKKVPAPCEVSRDSQPYYPGLHYSTVAQMSSKTKTSMCQECKHKHFTYVEKKICTCKFMVLKIVKYFVLNGEHL